MSALMRRFACLAAGTGMMAISLSALVGGSSGNVAQAASSGNTPLTTAPTAQEVTPAAPRIFQSAPTVTGAPAIPASVGVSVQPASGGATPLASGTPQVQGVPVQQQVPQSATDGNAQRAPRQQVESPTVTPPAAPRATAREAELEAEVRAMKAALKDTEQRLRQTEEAYGELPRDANGDTTTNAADMAGIPAVPAAAIGAGNGGGGRSQGQGAAQRNLTVSPGINQIVTISVDQPNRIVTPFAHPQVLSSQLQGGQGKECGEICAKGRVVYVSTAREYPVGVFITDRDNENNAISLTLVPRRIPPREVVLSLADSGNATTMQGGAEAKAWEESQPFVTGIKGVMRALALGEIPDGHTLQRIPRNYHLPVCSQNGFKVTFKGGQLLAGVNLNYVIGTVQNVSKKRLEFKEASCGNFDIAAVSLFPYNVMNPGERSEIYIAQRVPVEGAPRQKRRSLLAR